MKTIAVRLGDDVMDLLTVVSQLEGTSIVEQIRDAITAHLERKVAGGELATKAQEALEDIDREAAARKEAIGALIGELPTKTEGAAKSRSRRGQAAPPEGLQKERLPMGFAPGGGGRRKATSLASG